MLQCFFAGVGMMIPCFDQERFLGFYEHAMQNQSVKISVDRLGTLNMMFAFAAYTSSTSSPGPTELNKSQTYCQRAWQLANASEGRAPGLESCKAKYIM